MTTFPVESELSPAPESLHEATSDRQLEAADLAAFESWLQNWAGEFGLALTLGSIQDQTDIYLDTEDWRFYRAGYALSLRRQSPVGNIVARLSRLDEAAGQATGLEPRREVTEALANGNLETLRAAQGPVGLRLRALAGSVTIRPLFAVQTRRKSSVLAHETARSALVVMDESRILRGPGQEPARLGQVRVVEAEAAAGMVDALVDAACLEGVARRAGRSKFAAGLEALALTPALPLEFGPVDIDETLSLGELALAHLRRHFANFLVSEPGARLGDDPEDLHRMRVASRRLRAALSLFAECLPRRAAHLRNELQWVAAGLGQVRDMDVQLERVETWKAEAGPGGQDALEPLKALLVEQRMRARTHLLALLDSRRYAHFVGAFTAMLKLGLPRRLRQLAGRQPALEGMPPLILARYNEMRVAGDDLAETSPPQAYHVLRIRSKRLRYTLEFVRDLYGERAADLERNVVALQDLLGLHQDAIVAMDQLRALTETRGRQLPPPTIFAMGEITQRYAHLAADCRHNFPEAYARVQGKFWKRLRQELKTRQQTYAST